MNKILKNFWILLFLTGCSSGPIENVNKDTRSTMSSEAQGSNQTLQDGDFDIIGIPDFCTPFRNETNKYCLQCKPRAASIYGCFEANEEFDAHQSCTFNSNDLVIQCPIDSGLFEFGLEERYLEKLIPLDTKKFDKMRTILTSMIPVEKERELILSAFITPIQYVVEISDGGEDSLQKVTNASLEVFKKYDIPISDKQLTLAREKFYTIYSDIHNNIQNNPDFSRSDFIANAKKLVKLFVEMYPPLQKRILIDIPQFDEGVEVISDYIFFKE